MLIAGQGLGMAEFQEAVRDAVDNCPAGAISVDEH